MGSSRRAMTDGVAGLRRRWATLRRLTPDERRSTAVAFVLLAAVDLGVRWIGFGRLQGRLARWLPAPVADGDAASTVAWARTVARAVDRAARYCPLPTACLTRSLVLWWLLRRQGHAAELRIGVRRPGEALEAHAWVEYEGLVLNDGTDVAEHFLPFDGSVAPASKT